MDSRAFGQDLLVGIALGHYRIVEKIGAGGMGEVYRAHDEHLARDVAIKVLPPGTLIDESARKHFHKEALILSQLNHPNIATIYDFDTQQGVDFLVMEYIPGITLSEKVAAGPLAEKEVLRLGVQLAEGLAAAHEQGVIHRDLKPGNVRVTADGRVKILDFGLAKLVGPFSGTESTQSLGESQAVAGTLPYMAPEQLRGQACDARTDIYSAGAVLYEMVTGQRLFPGAQSGELVDAIFHREPTPAGKVNSKVSLALEAVIGKALDKNPAYRQQRARELLADLQALAAPSDAVAPAAAMQWLGWLKWRMRRQYRALLVAVAFILAALLSMVWLSGRSPTLAFAARDFVLVSDFDNQTGDPVFDKSLTTAFTTSLGQSSYANIYSRLRIAEALKRMKKSGVDRIDEPLAQEIAVREGLKVIVLPSISGVGESYRVAASIRDVASGKNVKTEFVKANGKNKVLDAVDTLSAAIREDLGESLQTVSQSKRLSSVTTQSLDALRQYSIGAERASALQWDEAKVYFENALRIDPSFTAARASLGMLHVEQAMDGLPHFDGEEGKRLLSDAVKHVDGLTDREKYGILAFHARAVEKNPEQAIGYLKTLIALYPDDSHSHVNLGRAYLQMGRVPEALAEYKEAIRIDPRLVLAYGNLGSTYLYQMGDVASAMPVCQKVLELDTGNAWAQDCLGWSYFAKNELPQAQAAFEKAVAANPQGTLSRYRLAHTHRAQGHYQQAIETLQQIQKVDPSETSVLYDMGVVYEGMGDRQKARESFTRYRHELETQSKKTLHEPGKQLDMAVTYARLGETGRARQLLREAMAKAPQLHLDVASVLSLLGEKKEAVDQLELAIQNGYTNYIWLRMNPDLLPLHGYPAFEQLMGKVIKM
ncbi:MAG: protein kinase [Candidatus Korobacteraceae bacterium]|jgi:tetratricopeptide (TPR) repeat protein/predicted Ser/Thr protein kinase